MSKVTSSYILFCLILNNSFIYWARLLLNWLDNSLTDSLFQQWTLTFLIVILNSVRKKLQFKHRLVLSKRFLIPSTLWLHLLDLEMVKTNWIEDEMVYATQEPTLHVHVPYKLVSHRNKKMILHCLPICKYSADSCVYCGTLTSLLLVI